MLEPQPLKRVSSSKALGRFKKIMANFEQGDDSLFSRREYDGSYFDSVIENFEVCTIPDFLGGGGEEDSKVDSNLIEEKFVKPRPLHYVLTFDRKLSLGLVLSEATVDDSDSNEDEELTIDSINADDSGWKLATQNAEEGEVFVREIIPDGQADKLGIVEVGDRLVGVGDFPFTNNGFEGFLNMLEKVPEKAKSVKVHFDRLPTMVYQDIVNDDETAVGKKDAVVVSSQGAFSTQGRRKSNEDAVILQEIKDGEMHSVLIGGVFDGHGGDAASKTASQILPSLFSTKLKSSKKISQALGSAWEDTCDTYKEGCTIYGSCVAEYDPREGVLLAGIGSKDLVAGTTASVAALAGGDSDNMNELVILNCGDSRTLIVGRPNEPQNQSCLHFATFDHSPKSKIEAERLQEGRDNGLDYSLPQCSINRWWIRVGDYQYAVSRSLEGEFATSKGIVSDADIEVIDLSKVLNQRKDVSLVVASDGLYEVFDSEVVAKQVVTMRENGISAKDVAKQLCFMAIEKGSTDNVSVVIWYFD